MELAVHRLHVSVRLEARSTDSSLTQASPEETHLERVHRRQRAERVVEGERESHALTSLFHGDWRR